MKNHLTLKIFSVLVIALTSETSSATPEALTFQGRLVNSGVPVEGSSVQLTLAIKSPGVNECLLFEEVHTLNMANSDGLFTVKIGGGVRTGSDKGLSLTNVFSNMGVAMSGLSCTGGATSYTSTSTDSRNVYVSFNDGGTNVAFSSPYVVQSVPYALEAQKLAGKSASDFLQTIASLEATPGTTKARANRILDTDYNILDALLNGASPKYMTSSATEGASLPVLTTQPTLSAGKIWYEGGAIKYYDATSSSVKSLGGGGGSGTVTNITAGAGLSGGPITTSGTLSLAPVINPDKISMYNYTGGDHNQIELSTENGVNNATQRGIYANLDWGGGANGGSNLYGAEMSLDVYPSGTLNSAVGFASSINSSSGATANAYGFKTSVVNSATITNAYGLHIGSVQGTNRWSIYASDNAAPSYFAGNVGVGTATPQSALHVSGYLQLDLTSGAPPATDCSSARRGRMKVDSAAGVIYVCVDAGWVQR